MLQLVKLPLRFPLSLSSGLTPTKSLILWLSAAQGWLSRSHQQLQVFGAAMGLVILPVFFQAPLVRYFPWVSLAMTPLWLGLGAKLMKRPQWEVWGDLIVGFGWIWLTGTLYWGWCRWEPVMHLPIEALGMPIAVLCLYYGSGRVGSYFFLGSLLGTAITDLYINWMHLFPVWRQLMEVEPDVAPVVLRAAAVALETDVAACRAVVLAIFLLVATAIALFTSRQLAWWAFGGAVLSTLIVDGLFFFSAMLA
ncbi:DUF3120 domain-containing protein [Phormidium sp. FACHB-1136]|uniref:DUF3120 domain-containing protein n=1 Tax=Phormidium sp. FACHB-1136 TaxID=2692848 RepID=UPI001F54D607|nr:DUF3120 domain-containing protein [Phormidium sp. FACHB-1136]